MSEQLSRRKVASVMPVLFGAVIALIGATVYNYSQMNQLRMEIIETRDLLAAQISQVSADAPPAPAAAPVNTAALEELREELEETRTQAAELAGQAKREAVRRADEVATKLQQMQQQQAAQLNGEIAGVSNQVSEVRQANQATNSRVGEVSSEVASVLSQTNANRSDLDRTISDLRTARGDLGIQSGLIATNADQLAALKALGERDYIEFTLTKNSVPTRLGNLYVRLRKTNERKNQYNLDVIVDDKRVEKKDRTVNEPVQFIVPPAMAPYEFVVNEVGKDTIKGYVSMPKAQVQQARN